MFGPQNAEGEESFDLVVCNNLWAEQQRARGENPDPHQLVVERFDASEIEEYLHRAASDSSGTDWKEVAEKLGRFGKWEFDGYVE